MEKTKTVEKIVEKDVDVQSGAKRVPEKKFVSGAIQASIWKNSSKEGKPDFHTVSLQRSYKDKSGQWQHTASLRVSDLPRVRLVVDEAFKYLAMPES